MVKEVVYMFSGVIFKSFEPPFDVAKMQVKVWLTDHDV